MRATKLAVLVIVTLTAFISANGQSAYSSAVSGVTPATETGVRPYMPYGGSHENINYTNGNINIVVPLLTLPGRNHHDLTLNYVYDSKIWKFVAGYDAESNGVGGFWATEWRGTTVGPDYSAGWHLNIPFINYSYSIDWTTSQCTGTTVVTLADGAKYSFQNNAGCGANVLTDAAESPSVRLDATNTADVILLLPDGSKVHFNSLATIASKVVDADGNYIEYRTDPNTGALTSIIDTLGREVVIGSSSIRYKDVNGVDRDITFALQSASVSQTFKMPQTSCRTNANGSCDQIYVWVSSPASGDGGFTGYDSVAELTSVTFPNGTKYQFAYHPSGEIKAVQYPSGGYTAYEYSPYNPVAGSYAPVHFNYVGPNERHIYADFREIRRKFVCPSIPQTAISNIPESIPDSGLPSDLCPGGGYITKYTASTGTWTGGWQHTGMPANETMQVDFPDGSREIHYIQGGSPAGEPPETNILANEYKVEHYSATGTRLRTVETSYTQSYGWAFPSSIKTTNDQGQAKTTTYSYDTITIWHANPGDIYAPPGPVTATIDNVLEQDEYDYGNTLRRKTINSWDKSDFGISSPTRLLKLKTKEEVYDPTNLVSSTTFEFDNYSRVAMSGSNALRHDGAYGTGFTRRGNITAVTQRTDSSDPSAVWQVTKAYDDAGNVVSLTEPPTAGNSQSATTTVVYGATAGCQCPFGTVNGCTVQSGNAAAYPSQITNSVGHVTTYQFSACGGVLTQATDANQQPIDLNYDLMGRLVSAYPGLGSEILHSYSDTATPLTPIPFWTASRTKKETDGSYIATRVDYDGLGRPTSTKLCEDGSITCTAPIITQTTYDSMGRKATETNPYRAQTDSTYGMTTYTYDALGRIINVQRPDGGNVVSSYTGDVTLVTDEAGKQRQTETDFLGRLVRVYEPGDGVNTIQVTGGGGGAGTPATGTVTINTSTGNAKVWYEDPDTGQGTWLYNSGLVYVTVGTTTKSANYSGSLSSASSIATSIASGFNSDSNSPVTAVSSSNVITFTAKGVGLATNYQLSATSTYDTNNFTGSRFPPTPSGSTLTGGTDATGQNQLAYRTNYTYDILGNLTYVEQRGNVADTSKWRTRGFGYDMAGRLKTATNPESGTINYTYDQRGNVASKTDARGQVISYCYDQIGRLAKKQYSASSTCASPNVTFYYDASQGGLSDPYPKGRRTGMTYGTTSAYWSHDALGRVTTERRTINGQEKETTYTYKPNSAIETIGYPHLRGTQGRQVTFTYDGAGRPASVASSGTTYATATSYSPAGALTSGYLGATISLTNSYNDRLQPITLTAAAGGNTLMSRTYDFHHGIGDNGNVYAITDGLDSLNLASRPVGSAAFTYDGVNRITSAQSTGTDCTAVGNSWKNYGQSFTIDAWGNLTNVTVTKCYANGFNQSVDTNNRLSGPNRYDAAGNLIEGGFYSYDAESRLASVSGGATYTYDADGNRVAKLGVANATLYWTGTGSDALTETNSSGTPTADYIFFGGKRIARIDNPGSGETVHYYISDHLGSATVIASASGANEGEMMYFAFGDQRWSNGATINHYRFTGKERDTETGLDYFGARYYGSNMARFMTPDWSEAPTPVPFADVTDPQTLNLYGYVRNNPVAKIDPDGHDDDEPIDGVGKELTNTVIGLYNLGNRAATKVSNLLSGRNDQPRQEPMLTASSRAQSTVMTLTSLALIFIPESRAEWADVQIERAATKIENIGTRNLTNETLQAASREVNGGMAVAKTGGGQFSHVTKVEQAIGGLNKQITHLEKVLKKTGLSEAQVGKISVQLDKAKGLLKVAQKAITKDPL